jgi:hypothetical protein
VLSLLPSSALPDPQRQRPLNRFMDLKPGIQTTTPVFKPLVRLFLPEPTDEFDAITRGFASSRVHNNDFNVPLRLRAGFSEWCKRLVAASTVGRLERPANKRYKSDTI